MFIYLEMILKQSANTCTGRIQITFISGSLLNSLFIGVLRKAWKYNSLMCNINLACIRIDLLEMFHSRITITGLV